MIQNLVNLVNQAAKQAQHSRIYFLKQNFPIDDILWEGITGKHEVKFLKELYEVDAENKTIKILNAEIEIPNSFYPLLLNYLKKKDILEKHNNYNFISPKFREDWALFFRAVHSLKEELVLSIVKEIDDLKNICKYFNGKELEHADYSFYLEPLKGIRIAYLYWKGDEDFPPSLTILFDEILTKHFMQDFVWGVVVETNSRIRNIEYYKSLFKD